MSCPSSRHLWIATDICSSPVSIYAARFKGWVPAQAKELLDHLEGVLSNEPAEVVAGNSIVEVKPTGVSKGGAVERILSGLAAHGAAPEFVLCIGDDRSDEDMFTATEHVTYSPHLPAEVDLQI